MSGRVSVVHTVASLAPSTGGPARVVPELCEALRAGGAEVELLAADRDRPLAAVLAERCRRLGAGLVHDHGIWLPSNRAVARTAARLGLPRVVSPHGMLEPRALRHHGWRKRLAWRLYQRRDLKAASLLHATGRMEAESLRRLGLGQPIAVIAYGVTPPEDRVPTARPPLRRLLFLSRLHPMKGLLDLVEAWSEVRAAGWEVVVAGPDEGGHRSRVEAAVAAVGLADSFRFVGPLTDQAKSLAYRAADLFVLPSHSENFGLVVAEALAAGVPVITTRGTPWRELEETGCGWWIEAGPEPLAAALTTATSLDRERLVEMGARGRRLIEERYSWPVIAQRMLGVYEWLLGPRPGPPGCVLR